MSTPSPPPQLGPKGKRNPIRSIFSRLGGNKRQQGRPSSANAHLPRQGSWPLADVSNVQEDQAVDSHELMLSNGTNSGMERGYSRSSSESGNGHGADTNASTRPITPTSVLTSGSTSNLSHSRSNATGQSHPSTKPTTLLSQHSDGGANRIAQPSGFLQHSQSTDGGSNGTGGLQSGPSDAQTNVHRLSSLGSAARRDSGNTTGSVMPSSASITFSALPPSSPPTVGPSGSPMAPPIDNLPASPMFDQGIFRYPSYSQPQTKNNPQPGGVPPDNASTLTLASSMAPSLRNYAARHDEDASVRALPPSRRDSGASLASKWSAVMLSGRGARPASLVTVGTTGSTPLKSGIAATVEGDPSPEQQQQQSPKEAAVHAREELTPPSTPQA